MTTIVFTSNVIQSDRLTRRILESSFGAAWAAAEGAITRFDVIAPGTTLTLVSCSILLVAASLDASVIVGWTPTSGPPVEFSLNQLAVVSPPAGAVPYIRSSISSPAPGPTVRSITIS